LNLRQGAVATAIQLFCGVVPREFSNILECPDRHSIRIFYLLQHLDGVVALARADGSPMRTRAIAELLAGISGRSYNRGFTAGLHAAQWEALRYFARANESARTVTSFADARGTTQGTATQTVTALVKKGLLMRRQRSDDLRSRQLDLTDHGRDLLASDPLQALVDAVAGLSGEDREALAQGLIALHQQLRQSG
jgi:DNA-binding MarR family transcriptional regulator